MAYDFNTRRTRRELFSESVGAHVDEKLEAERDRPREGIAVFASQIGDECKRRMQYEMRGAPCEPFGAKMRRIFKRGHILEEHVASWLRQAGFNVSCYGKDGKQHGFSVADGQIRGRADGVIVAGPEIDGLVYPCLWENKVLGAKGWRALQKDGLAKAHPKYADQVALYQFYLDLTAPALVTALNADTMEIWYEAVPFDAARAQAVSDRAVQVLQATLAGDLLPRVSDDPDGFPCAWCRFNAHCWERA